MTRPAAPKTLLATVVLLAGLALPGAAAAECLSQREAAAAVRSGDAVRLSQVARRVGGDIVDARLCEAGGRLVYRLAVMGSGGRVTTVLVDARTGRVLDR